MAKSISINLDETYESRAGTLTVKDAIAWLESNTGSEDEESGETTDTMTPGQAICYAVRRMQALHKDAKRIKKGKAPSRIYTPRVAEVEGAAKTAAAAKEEARATFARALHITLTKPEPKAPAKKVAKPSTKKPATKKTRKPADAGGADVSL